MSVCVYMCVFVYVCVRERGRDRERQRDRVAAGAVVSKLAPAPARSHVVWNKTIAKHGYPEHAVATAFVRNILCVLEVCQGPVCE